MKQYKYKKQNTLIALLLSAACLLGGCSKSGDGEETDTQSDIVGAVVSEGNPTSMTETEEVTTAAITTEAVTEETTEAVTTETVTETETESPVIILTPVETETPSETEFPVGTELPSETETEPAVLPDTEPVTDAPVVETPKPVIDLSDKAVRGGDAVTGTLESAQSEYIRLLVDYSLLWGENGDYMLTLEVGLSYYELWCSEKSANGTITVDGVSRTFASPAIEHEEHREEYTSFFTQTYNCTGNTTASIDVSWIFGGTYGGTEIGTLSTGAILQWEMPGDDTPDHTAAAEVPAPAEPEPVETESVTEAITEAVTEIETEIVPIEPETPAGA
ncbi:MAG: hypothetical protein IJ449_03870 [Clostridia bacterium]|nr:hypothetical protein [Clostridia bacterium]